MFGEMDPKAMAMLELVVPNVPLAMTLLLDIARILVGDFQSQYALLSVLWIADGALYHAGLIKKVPVLKDFAPHLLTAAVTRACARAPAHPRACACAHVRTRTRAHTHCHR